MDPAKLLGEAREALGRFDHEEAARILDPVLEGSPASWPPGAAELAARAREATGQVEEAQALLGRRLEAHPEGAVRFQLAELQCLVGEPGRALEVLGPAAPAAEDEALAAAVRGHALLGVGRLDEATAELDHAHRLATEAASPPSRPGPPSGGASPTTGAAAWTTPSAGPAGRSTPRGRSRACCSARRPASWESCSGSSSGPRKPSAHFHAALETFRRCRYHRGLVRTYLSLGLTHLDTGESELAEIYLVKAMGLAEDGQDRASLALACGRMGTLELARNRPSRALPWFERDLALSEESGRPFSVPYASLHVGRALSELDRPGRRPRPSTGPRRPSGSWTTRSCRRSRPSAGPPRSPAARSGRRSAPWSARPGARSPSGDGSSSCGRPTSSTPSSRPAPAGATRPRPRSRPPSRPFSRPTTGPGPSRPTGSSGWALAEREPRRALPHLQEGYRLAAAHQQTGWARSFLARIDAIDETALVALELGASERRRDPGAAPPDYRVVTGGDLLGRSAAMEEIRDLVQRVATTDLPVLVLGETGTGKELVARAIHWSSRRRSQPLITINCGAIPDALLESELFGHRRGAFTGAASDRAGILERADGGTVFLDEIGDLPGPAQVKLLRYVQYGEIQKLGGSEVRSVDTRVLAATHRDLEHEVREGRFREDLYYRLLRVPDPRPPAPPPPRGRPRFSSTTFSTPIRCSPSAASARSAGRALELLRRHPWPGNVRQLQAALLRAAVVARGDSILASDLDLEAHPSIPEPSSEAREILSALDRTGASPRRCGHAPGHPPQHPAQPHEAAGHRPPGLSTMRFLITGATGFIGLHLCRALRDAGHHVTALVRSPSKGRLLPDGVELLEGDLSIFGRPETALPASEVVIHLAGVVAADTLDRYDEINHRAVKDLVACLEGQEWTPRRLLFASSLAAAGPSSPTRPWTEADPTSPIDPYGEAKARAEEVVAAAPFPTTSFRPCIVLGPGDPASLTLFRSARSGIGLRVAGEPQRLSFVDVRDVVSAIERMAEDERPGHHTYFVSHPDPMDVRELWAGLRTAVGNPVAVIPVPRPVLYLAMRIATLAARVLPFTNQLDAKQYVQMTAPAFLCSSAALSEDLGWVPAHGLVDTLAHAAAGYRDAGLLR